MSESEVVGELSRILWKDRIDSMCYQSAADERAYKFRHPIPTDNRLERYVMLVASVRRHGLQASATRLVHFGELPPELRDKHQACALVDACFCLETKPGARVPTIFARAMQTYAATGYQHEWRLHHQGGACGYAGRDYKATPDTDEVVLENQAFAWNPGFREYFAVKATPTPAILAILKEEGCGLDCSSLTELMLAEACGFRGDQVILSSNVTPDEDFLLAARLGAVINLDFDMPAYLDVLAAYGILFKHEKIKTTTLLATHAYITSGLIESVLKITAGRSRPSTYIEGQAHPIPSIAW